MAKPQKTAADYMIIALSPALIMMLVGSLCFFLIDVFYRGKMIGAVCWVMFWFVIGIVLVSRIAIEKSTEHAALYGLGLALAKNIAEAMHGRLTVQSEPGVGSRFTLHLPIK